MVPTNMEEQTEVAGSAACRRGTQLQGGVPLGKKSRPRARGPGTTRAPLRLARSWKKTALY